MASLLSVSTPRTFRASIATSQRAARPISLAAYKVTFVNDKGVSKDIMCDEDEFLLDAADAGGVDLPASCRGGVCGTCVSKLVEGKVDLGWACELDDGSVLSKEQMDAGYILCCSAKPLTDIKVEYCYDWGVSILEDWKSTSRDNLNCM